MVHNSLNRAKAKLPTAGNHVDLNKEPNIDFKHSPEIVDHSEHTTHLPLSTLENIKSYSNFLSLAMPTAQSDIPHEALEANFSAVALGIQGLKMDSVHDRGTEIDFFYKERPENSLNVEAVKLDHVTDTMGYLGSARAGGKTADNVCGLTSLNESNSFGPLCYEIPKLEYIVPSHSPIFSTHHVLEGCGDGFQSPVGYTTSPVDGELSGQQSIESILKSAAENFPGTPSILRRKKREKPSHAQDSDLKINILNSDSFHTPLGKCTPESPHSFKTATFLSLGPADDKGLSAALGSFDVSPPYRLRSKRLAILRTFEKKQLDFSSDCMNDCDTPDNMKSISWNTKYTNSRPDVSSMQEKKMKEHMIGLEALAKDSAQTIKYSCWI